ncbi:hypothetical protein DEO72_LG5g1065 [Vigna unguiculata]|uniref:Uncharacterized protein n=1 Tax=Vigna unguiculata TaxID=3917 RepID=A0A4D6LWE5_VIGUN|nr:hypothetical protein DEO72_LG5g1065 [Vigna unguiculata]
MHDVVVFREVTPLQADGDERGDVSRTSEATFWVNETLRSQVVSIDDGLNARRSANGDGGVFQ